MEQYEINSKSSIGKTYRQLLFNLLIRCSFKNVLEIGCFRGYSSCAFLEALNHGCNFQYTICDPKPKIRPELLETCSKKDKITITTKSSLEVISPKYDFIFIDGDHSTHYVGFELMKLIDSNIETMLAHDTYIENPKYKGANLYRYCFAHHKDYHYVEDSIFRQNESTVLCGLSFFTKNIEIYNKVYPLFEQIRQVVFI